MPLQGKQLGGAEVASIHWFAGWRDENLIIANAVAYAESNFYTRAYNDQNSDGSVDRGILQVNSRHFGPGGVFENGPYTFDDMFDPKKNAEAAYIIYKRSRYTFRPWAAYTSGRYTANLVKAIPNIANMWRLRYGIPTH